MVTHTEHPSRSPPYTQLDIFRVRCTNDLRRLGSDTSRTTPDDVQACAALCDSLTTLHARLEASVMRRCALAAAAESEGKGEGEGGGVEGCDGGGVTASDDDTSAVGAVGAASAASAARVGDGNGSDALSAPQAPAAPAAPASTTHPTTPRLLRLADKLQLGPKEITAFLFLLLREVGVEGPEEYRSRGILARLRGFTGMGGKELMAFLSAERPHMQQNVLECDDEFGMGISMKMQREAVKALHGGDLTVDEFLKIDDTALAKVLQEEPGFAFGRSFGRFGEPGTSAGAARESRESTAYSGRGGNGDGDGDDDEDDCARGVDGDGEDEEEEEDPEVAALIASLQGGGAGGKDVDEIVNAFSRGVGGSGSGGDEDKEGGTGGVDSTAGTALPDSGGSGGGSSGVGDGGGGRGGDGGNELDSYTDDLSYLEDSFQLIIHRIRRYANDMDDDKDSYALSLSKKKPEAIKRELEAKERQARARWERRLSRTLHAARSTLSSSSSTVSSDRHSASTQGGGGRRGWLAPRGTDGGKAGAGGGGDSWLPRMEGLAERLSLDEFEKMVVLTLVGSVISQDVRKAMKSGSLQGFGGGGRGVDVGTLLGVHCDTLEQQIKSRRYFYKMGKLVKSGVVTLSDRRYVEERRERRGW